MNTTLAVLFLPSGACSWLDSCAQYTARHGYQVVAVVSVWADAVRIARENAAVLVAGRREHLPADRLPRLEIVVEESAQLAELAPSPTQRRPRLQR